MTSTALVRFALLAALAFGIALADATAVLQVDSPLQAIPFAAETWFVLLPAALGVTIASLSRVDALEAGVLVGLTMAIMLGLDFLPGSSVTSTNPQVAITAEGEMLRGRALERWSGTGSWGVVSAHLSGRLEGAADPARIYTVNAVRLQVAHAYMKLAFLLVPIAIVGFVLGAGRWIERSVLFTSRATERVVEFLSGWVLGPVLLAISIQLGSQATSMVLFDGFPFWAVFLPMASLAALSGVGWYAAAPGRGE